MSTIRVNEIIDAAGGNTATINGKSPLGTSDLASQAEAQAGTDNTKLMTPLRTAQAVAALVPAPTTAQVLSATAGASAGAVGTYAFLLENLNSTARAAGYTSAGSNLRYSSFNNSSGSWVPMNSGATPSGTWMLVGQHAGSTAVTFVSTWLRIS